MASNKKTPAARASADRLAALAGVSATSSGAAAMAAPGPPRRVSVEPDVTRIRKCAIEETPEERKKRLAAKSVNFGASFFARILILGAAGYFLWIEFQSTGQIHRAVATGVFAMVADFGRVVMKAMTPGSK